MKVYVVIAAYNEEENIAAVVRSVLAVADKVVVVDDCSHDRTGRAASEAGAEVLSFVVNRGQGAALRAGTRWALADGADVIVHFDADGQFRAEDIPLSVEPIVAGRAEVVLGSRFLNAATKMPNTKRYLIMPLARFINELAGGIRLTDPQSGFRVMSAATASRLEWRQDRMAHCTEILALISEHQFKVEEVPITVLYHGYGQRMADGYKIVFDLILKRLLS
ncbi:MAG: glycosyltransferase family 2 protein [Candidatus Falkowbacteria bacterium]